MSKNLSITALNFFLNTIHFQKFKIIKSPTGPKDTDSNVFLTARNKAAADFHHEMYEVYL